MNQKKEKNNHTELVLNEEKINSIELEDLFSIKNKLKLLIEKQLNNSSKGQTLLFLIQPEHYSLARELLLDFISKNNSIYISLNKPATYLINSNKEISLNKIHFIDMISALNLEKENTSQISFLNSPNALSESLVELDSILEKNQSEFIALDSISTLLVYNEVNSVEKFLHNLASKINQLNSIGLFLFIESDEYKKPIQTIEQFCDKIIKLNIN